MKRNKALEILIKLSNSPNMVKHAVATEAVMRTLARRFEPEKEEEYALCGLLHDADYEETEKSLAKHTDLVTEKINGKVPQEIIDAIRGHCDKIPRTSQMAKALYAADELTGLIVACALVQPDKRLKSVSVESVLKKFKDKSFAKGARRDQIKTCEDELGISLDEFVGITLSSMQAISGDLGL